jgi:hypothetical protein
VIDVIPAEALGHQSRSRSAGRSGEAMHEYGVELEPVAQRRYD